MYVYVSCLGISIYIYIWMQQQLMKKEVINLIEGRKGIWKVLEEENGKETRCNYIAIWKIKI